MLRPKWWWYVLAAVAYIAVIGGLFVGALLIIKWVFF